MLRRRALAGEGIVGPLVSVQVVRVALDYLRGRGHDIAPLLASVGLGSALFEDEDTRVPLEKAVRVWVEGARLAGDEAFGLRVAETLTPGSFHVLDYLSRSSATLGRALERLSRYHRLINDAARLEVSLKPRVCHVRLHAPHTTRHWAEFGVAAWVVGGRQATGVAWSPREVWFAHRAPRHVGEHRRLFGCPVRFGRPSTELIVDRSVLDLPLLRADAGLSSILEEHLRQQLRRLPGPVDVVDGAWRALLAELADGEPKIEAVARRLGLSTRTYRRRLKKAGSSHRELLESLRRELAVRYLQEERPTAEVAFLLGFSEVSAFHRFFSRSMGTTPAEYRRRLART